MRGTFQNSSSFTKLCLLALIILACAIFAIAISSAYLLLTNDPRSTDSVRIMLFLQNLLLFVASPLIAQYFLWSTPISVTLQLTRPPLRLILFGCLAILFSGPVIDMLNTWNQSLRLPDSMNAIEQWMIDSEKQAENLTKQLLNVDNWKGFISNILIIAVLAGLGEELLFRGVLQKILIKWTSNIHWGIFITAVLFSAIHLQFFGFLPRLVLGVLLGYLCVWSRSLWVPIIAHTLNNAWVIIFTPNNFNHGNATVTAIQQTENNIWYVLISISLTALCLYGIRKSYFSPSAN